MIRVPYHFEGDLRPEEKLFVILCHKDSFAICIKATSKTAIFRNNPAMMKGCVWFPARRVDCFPLDTAVEPDNQIPIPYESIRKAEYDGVLEVHQLPAAFEIELRAAINNSVTLSPRKRQRIQEMF